MSRTLLTAFNNILIKFVAELIETYPQENTFRVLKAIISLMKKVNPRKVLHIFMKNVAPYKKRLLHRDETFFLNENYSAIMEDSSNKKDAWQLMSKLKLYWKYTSQENKNVIWNYFKILLTLAEKIQ